MDEFSVIPREAIYYLDRTLARFFVCLKLTLLVSSLLNKLA